MAAKRITEEMLDQLQESLMLRKSGPEQFVERAELEYVWASDTDAYELEPGLDRSYVLSVAADDFLLGEKRERARDVALEARAAAGPGEWHAHISPISAYAALGEIEQAKAVADEVRSGAASDPMTAQMVGESFELADELPLAERWYAIGLRAADRLADDFSYERLLRDRYRVRRDQQKPLDGFDEEFEELSAE